MRRHIELGQERCMSFERIAEKAGVHDRTVRRYAPKVQTIMDSLSNRFFDMADEHFAGSGLIRAS